MQCMSVNVRVCIMRGYVCVYNVYVCEYIGMCIFIFTCKCAKCVSICVVVSVCLLCNCCVIGWTNTAAHEFAICSFNRYTCRLRLKEAADLEFLIGGGRLFQHFVAAYRKLPRKAAV